MSAHQEDLYARANKVLHELGKYRVSLLTVNDVLFLITKCRCDDNFKPVTVCLFDEEHLEKLEEILKRVRETSRAHLKVLPFPKQ